MVDTKNLHRHDYIILGADRWALQLGCLLKKADRNYLIINSGQESENTEGLEIENGVRIFYIDKNRADRRFALIDESGNLYNTRILLISGSGGPRKGQRFNDNIFANSCRPQKTDNGLPIITAELESTNIEGLFFLGNHTNMRAYREQRGTWDRDFQVTMLHRFLEHKYHNVDLCRHRIPHNAETVKNLVHNRMNLTNTGWRRPDYIGDFLVVEDDGKTARFYAQLTPDYFREHIARPDMIYYTLTIDDQEKQTPNTIVSKCQGWEIISECRLSGDPAHSLTYWNSKVDEIVAAGTTRQAAAPPF